MQIKTGNICRFILMFLTVVTPLYYGSVDWWVVYLIVAMVFSAIFLWLFEMIHKGSIHIYRLAPMPYLGLFLLLGLLSVWHSDYKWLGKRELLLYLAGIGVCFLSAHLLNRIRYLRLFNRTLLITATTLSFIGILQYLLAHPSGYKLSATFVNKNHFAGYLNMIIPFAITGIYLDKEIGKRIFLIYSLVIMLTAMLFTFSRGGWISLLFITIFLGITLFNPEKKKLKWAAISFFMLPILFLLFVNLGIKNISQPKRKDEINLPVRRRIYRSTLAMIGDHWVLGTGPGSFAAAFPRYRVAGLDFHVDYAHNDYLQFAAELGLGVLPIILLIIWTSFRAAWGKIRLSNSRTEKGTTIAAMAGILSILVHSAMDFNLHIPCNTYLFMVLLGLAVSPIISPDGE